MVCTCHVALKVVHMFISHSCPEPNTYPECHLFVSGRADSLFPQKQPQDVLVVAELNMAPVNSFLLVDRLLRFEDERVEEILQLLVRHVDAQLLKAVIAEVLEPRQI